MKEQKIFTEQPEEEMWRTILQFSYPANISRYLDEKNLPKDNKLIESISGSILQAYEYYNASRTVSMQTSPLLLYYGTTNLLFGFTNLLTGHINEIDNHGMRVNLKDNYIYISEASIHFIQPQNGGVHVFGKHFGIMDNLCDFDDWSVQELLGSIVEILPDYMICYPGSDFYALPIEEVQTENETTERIVLDILDEGKFLDIFNKIPSATKAYLRPIISPQNNVVLRRKINGIDITRLSYSNQKYLAIGHEKKGKLLTLPVLFNMYIILFAFSSLCRYSPEKWTPFIRNDTTGERLLIEKFMYYSRRLVPNIILDRIYGYRMSFVNEKYAMRNSVKSLSEHDTKELILNSIKIELDRRKIETNVVQR